MTKKICFECLGRDPHCRNCGKPIKKKRKLVCSVCFGGDPNCRECKILNSTYKKKQRIPCSICRGTDPACQNCKRLEYEEMHVDSRRRYLAELWLKARKFSMTDFKGATDTFEMDGLVEENANSLYKEVKKTFGDWIGPDGNIVPIPDEVRDLTKGLERRGKKK